MSRQSAAEGRQMGLRVLVVDDDPRVRLAISAELAAAGCRPTAIGPGQLTAATDEAIRAAHDVILIDVALPTVTAGLDLITALASGVPVIAFSINGAAREAALTAGAHAYLEKDGDTDRLLETLRTASAPATSEHDHHDTHDPRHTRS